MSAVLDPFVAIDFETANERPDSACAVALVRVEEGQIVRKEVCLIRPGSERFTFTGIHGITWAQVRAERPFAEVWAAVQDIVAGARHLAAHNASFDKRVLRACCESAGLAVPALPFVCTVQVARRVWNIRPTRLPDVCRALSIGLKHHDAASDAEACARILVEAGQRGWRPS
ncbi:MAG: 3'-5' exonuclease [Candidatus Latescibacteria bacterium]|nr:3'-5' exonuclease [Candidatus Latescibacterota bacterium]